MQTRPGSCDRTLSRGLRIDVPPEFWLATTVIVVRWSAGWRASRPALFVGGDVGPAEARKHLQAISQIGTLTAVPAELAAAA